MDGKEEFSIIKRGEDFVRNNPLFVGLIGLGVILLTIGVFQYLSSKNTKDEVAFVPSNPSQEVAGVSSQKEISIDVEGAVQKPGVYKLSEGGRVQDALIASGGMNSNADREYIAKHFNLAQKLTDGAKIYIPQKGEQQAAVMSVQENPASNNDNQINAGDNTGLININSADAEKLDTLPKVGPVSAQKIISGRPYSSKGELVSKKILTQKTFDGLKDKITVE